MAALTKARQLQTMFPREGYILPMNAIAATYWKGSFMGFADAGGNVRKAGTADGPHYAGICQQDIVIGTAGEQVDVLVNAPFWYDDSALAVAANILKLIYASNTGDLALAW